MHTCLVLACANHQDSFVEQKLVCKSGCFGNTARLPPCKLAEPTQGVNTPSDTEPVLCCPVCHVSRRLYAVGFATRQLTGTSKLPKDGPGALSLGNSCAHRAARQLLHDTAASMVATAILTGGTLQDPEPGTNSKLATLLPDVISKLYVVPGVLAEGEPLLQLAVTGPTDPLVPLQQQRELLLVPCIHGNTGGRRCNEKATDRMLYEKIWARNFMRLGCPEQWQQYQRELGAQLQHQQQQQDSSDADKIQDSSEQQEGARTQQQQASEGEQQRQREWERERERRWRHRASVVRLSDDVSQLMLVDPVPAECLLGPEVWWAWHEELTGLNSCDICGKEVNAEVRTVDPAYLQVCFAEARLPFCQGAAALSV